MLFPEKLHQLLSLPESEVDPGIVSWASHGRCFSVHHPRAFTRDLMPKFFSQIAFTSFQRQLNLYGFKRMTKPGSQDKGAYYHELFLRGKPGLCRRMRRQRVKGTGCKPLPDPDSEPDFYTMPGCYEDNQGEQENNRQEAHRLLYTEKSSTARQEKQQAKSPVPQEVVSSREGELLQSNSASSEAAATRPFPHNSLQIPMSSLGLAGCFPHIFASQSCSNKEDLSHTSLRLPEALSAEQQQAERLRAFDAILPTVRCMPSREMVLQDILMARAAWGSNDLRRSLGTAALRNEIELLEQTRRNIVLQQQRLQMIVDQSEAASSAMHLRQLSAVYENATGLACLSNLSSNNRVSILGDVEPDLALRAGHGFNQRLSLGGSLDLGGLQGNDVSMALGSAHLGSSSNNASSANTFNSLATMVASGRFTMAQLNEIEAILRSQRVVAAAAEDQNKL